MCPELTLLEITLKRQEIGIQRTLQSLVMDKFQNPNFGLRHLTEWATDILHEFGTNQNRIRRDCDGLDPELLSYVELGSNPFIIPKGNHELNKTAGPIRKRHALTNQDYRPTKARLTEALSFETEADTNITSQTDIDS